MKKIIFILMMLPVAVFGQNDVTTFLGIPVDGTKTPFIQKLKAKGFVSCPNYDLKGRFNGRDVYIDVQTNNNKVCRVVVEDQQYQNDVDIAIRFNTLLRQFRSNEKYMEFPVPNEMIEDGTDMYYEIRVKNKRFQASFYQKPNNIDPDDKAKAQALQDKIEKMKENGSESTFSSFTEVLGDLSGLYEKYLKYKLVWFMIDEQFGKYKIALFYENGHNMANGEDL